MTTQTAYRYEVRTCLAGFSGCNQYVAAYKSLPWAQRKANKLTGLGQYGYVMDRWTGDRVHTGRR